MAYRWKDCQRCRSNYAIWAWLHRASGDCVCSKCGGVWLCNSLCPSRNKVGPLVDEPCRCPGPCQACKEGMHHRECVNKGTNAGESVPGLDFLLSAKKEPKA